MKYKYTLNILDTEYSKKIHELEKMTGEQSYDKFGLHSDEVICETVKFENGMEVDIKLVIADDENYNWTEAVLFDNKGNQITYTEPDEVFFGEWYLEDHDGNSYTVEVNG